MKESIRNGVFETNSSSTHSISIRGGDYKPSEWTPDSDGNIDVYPGEFGWEYEDYYDPMSKASYCLTYAANDGEGGNSELLTMLREVIAETTGAKSVTFCKSSCSYNPWGYIDHQSDGVCTPAFESKESLRDFIFNPASELHTDNDNH